MYLSTFFQMKIVNSATQNFLLARSLPLTYVSASYTVLCYKSQAYEVKAKAVSTLFNNFLLCGVRPAYYKYTLYYTMYFTMYTVQCKGSTAPNYYRCVGFLGFLPKSDQMKGQLQIGMSLRRGRGTFQQMRDELTGGMNIRIESS